MLKKILITICLILLIPITAWAYQLGGSGNIDSMTRLGIGTTSPSINADLTLEGGVLNIKETTTPTPDSGYGKIYTTTADELMFQDGAGVEHTILSGASSVQHEFFAPAEDPTGTVGNWDIVEINTAQSVHFNFQVAEDFETLDNARIVMIPDASETIQWDVLVSVAAAGEDYNNDDRTGTDQQVGVTVNDLTEVDISAQLSGLAAGDYVAIDFQSDTANLRIVGFEFDFN